MRARLAGVEQHITQGDNHAAVGLLGLQVRQLLLGLRQLIPGALRLHLRGRNLARARGQENAVAFVLGPRHIRAGVRRLHARLARFGVALREVGVVIN